MTVAERINAERLMLAAWPRAILLQLAHPLVAAGVAEHSAFRDSPLTAARRLHGTVRAMLALSFGDPQARRHALEGILAIHRRVHGTLTQGVGPFPVGTYYSAEDPSLVLWVHVTLLDSVVLAYEALVAPLSPADRDTYVDDAAWVALELGARADEVPRTWPALERAIGAELDSGRIVVGPLAREMAPAIATRGLRTLTAGWLPPRLREEYGFAWSEARARRAARMLRALASVRRAMPRKIAWWPESRLR